MKKMTKDYFASLVGDAYDDYGYRKSTLTINSAAYEQIGEYFHDDDLLLEEWLHCQNCREPFVIHEEDEFGDELIFEIRTGEELFDYFENMRTEAECGIRKFRYDCPCDMVWIPRPNTSIYKRGAIMAASVIL